MSDPQPKTFDELYAESQENWRGILVQKQLAITKRQGQLAAMPDVVGAPKPGDTYSMVGIVCPACSGTRFMVTHWTWINGNNHRWDGYCLQCQVHNCWDWNAMGWMPKEAISTTSAIPMETPVGAPVESVPPVTP